MSRNLLPLYIALLSLGVASLVGGVELDDYCSPSEENTPCKTRCKQGSECGSVVEVKEMTDADRNEIVALHNEFRGAVAMKTASPNMPKAEGADATTEAATGRRKRLGIDAMPECKTMKALSYSKELEFLAECHIRSCSFEHDAVRMTADGQPAGQNLYMSTTSEDKFPAEIGSSAAKGWFKEIDDVGSTDEMTAFGSGKGIGHFTAMVWGPTEFVGCAKLHSSDGDKHNYFFYCDYQPAGNIIGASFCAAGDPCTEHPSGVDGLCGEVRPLSEDTFVPPDITDEAWRIGSWSIGLYAIWMIALRLVR